MSNNAALWHEGCHRGVEMFSVVSLTEHSSGFPLALWLLFIFNFALQTCTLYVANNLVFLESSS